jgi:hypothetical protein
VALRWERRHLVQKTWYHKRYTGQSTGRVEDCCFLLLSGPTDQFLLLQDGCLELLECQEGDECCIVRLDDTGSNTSVVLRLDDAGGADSCVEPLSCP